MAAVIDVNKEIEVAGTVIRFHADGIIEYVYGNMEIDEAHARKVIATATKAMDEVKPRLTLVQLGRVKSVSRDARNFFSGPENLAVASRVAMVGINPVARMIGNFFLGLNRPAVPVRLFGSTEEAMVWLQNVVP